MERQQHSSGTENGEAAAQLRYVEWRGSSTAQARRMERQQHSSDRRIERQQHSSGTENGEAAAQLRYGE